MSVPNPHLAELRSLSLGVDSSEADTAPLATPPWLNWCSSVIDHAFGFDLRKEELRQLLGSHHPR
jgi:hypothetical protein